MAAPPPPPLRVAESPPDEIIEEILLRLPPNEPSCLLRASLVCKPWRRIISHRRFRRRLHELHGTPPVLGFLRNNISSSTEDDFVPTTASAYPLALPHIAEWSALDCRHGRVLFHVFEDAPDSGEVFVWDPITGHQQRVPAPDAMWDATYQADHPTAAIVCAADGCDHRGGCDGPFCLVMVYTVQDEEEEEEEDPEPATWACLYSSETGLWGNPTKVADFVMNFRMHPTSVLLGDSLLYFLSDLGTIVEYNLGGDEAAIIAPPLEFLHGNDSVALILTEDGTRLGVAESFSDSRLNIWSRLVTDGTPLWVKSRVIHLHNLIPVAALEGEVVKPISFAERANVLFIRTPRGVFTIELHSQRVRKVCEDGNLFSLVPVDTFYIP